jgi:hypothetical protein
MSARPVKVEEAGSTLSVRAPSHQRRDLLASVRAEKICAEFDIVAELDLNISFGDGVYFEGTNFRSFLMIFGRITNEGFKLAYRACGTVLYVTS